MFTLDGIRKLHGWTHASLNLLLEHLSTIPPGDYGKELPSFGIPTLGQQVVHIFNCEGFWIHTLQGRNYIDRDPADCPRVCDAKPLQQQVQDWTHTYLSTLTDQQLNADTELRFPDGDSAVRTPALILHHVLTHAFHHKGQIVAMCRELGYPAPGTDMNQFE
ncbi:DinB family protein [Occallatibacter riparius]|uniref:DinB family protein n=1 Tax=Occallatibacter riparius TaxID=1002689 RepID=A0A9J7BUW8_9BACT|nr:DinB family protein [Occallatibacter riparius]UWZ86361.1 DinB family protein [Occallatibacter riparius]